MSERDPAGHLELLLLKRGSGTDVRHGCVAEMGLRKPKEMLEFEGCSVVES